jgi:hypothetical protein
MRWSPVETHLSKKGLDEFAKKLIRKFLQKFAQVG